MLLSQITLYNFRQYKGKQVVKFSNDSNRNVTFIMGKTGTGKTTFAQAFTWCLYGETDFADKDVVNKALIQETASGNSMLVYIELELKHKETYYYIRREQEYRVDNGILKRTPAKLTISYKDKTGNTKYVADSLIQTKIKEILPKELSKYFFFDGERIGNMSKEIQSGRSEEFAQAVQRLLGLDTYKAALSHLGGSNRAGKNNSVVGSYRSQYDNSSDSRLTKYNSEYEQYQDEIQKLASRKNDLENQIPTIQSECDRLNVAIERNKDGEQLARDRKRCEDEINRNNGFIDESTSRILSSFMRNYRYFFFQKALADSIDILASADKIDKGIPDIHKRTIDFLIQRGVCICGNLICEGSKEHDELVKLLEYIPPKNLGTIINEFIKDCKNRTNNGLNLFEEVGKILSEVSTRSAENEQIAKQIEDLTERISSFESISDYQRKLSAYKEELRRKQGELSSIDTKIGEYQTKSERVDSERRTLALQSAQNRKVAIYIEYATKIASVLSEDYKKRETEVRNELQTEINNIFKTIYNGGLSLKIDDRYNINTIVDDYSMFNRGVETSTAQSISIVFAFISSVIKLARDAEQRRQSDMEYDLSTEAYPLVMDAPLSAFDKERIQTVCETIPGIAEQVIIFIKDTDGEIAEKYLSDRIGARYVFDKKTEFETYINERK